MVDSETYKTAALLIYEHGGDANALAERRAEKALSEGDRDGYRHWQAIADAVVALIQEYPTMVDGPLSSSNTQKSK